MIVYTVTICEHKCANNVFVGIINPNPTLSEQIIKLRYTYKFSTDV